MLLVFRLKFIHRVVGHQEPQYLRPVLGQRDYLGLWSHLSMQVGPSLLLDGIEGTGLGGFGGLDANFAVEGNLVLCQSECGLALLLFVDLELLSRVTSRCDPSLGANEGWSYIVTDPYMLLLIGRGLGHRLIILLGLLDLWSDHMGDPSRFRSVSMLGKLIRAGPQGFLAQGAATATA